MFGEGFPQPNIAKAESPEHDDAWYEAQSEALLRGLPHELSSRLMNEIDEAELDAEPAYEKVQDFVRRRNGVVEASEVDIIDADLVHSELHEQEDEKILECVSREIADIRSSLADPGNFLGEGAVARVFESGTWPKVCYKVVHDEVAYRKGNPVYREVNFLGDLNDLSVEGVRAPHAYFHGHQADLIVIGMERVQGLSVEDVILRQPDALMELKQRGFDVKEFFRKLEAYVVGMHKRKIYHLDLFARNIMIDWETLDPRVIDFGKSKHFDFDSDMADHIEIADFETMKDAQRKFETALRD